MLKTVSENFTVHTWKFEKLLYQIICYCRVFLFIVSVRFRLHTSTHLQISFESAWAKSGVGKSWKIELTLNNNFKNLASQLGNTTKTYAGFSKLFHLLEKCGPHG